LQTIENKGELKMKINKTYKLHKAVSFVGTQPGIQGIRLAGSHLIATNGHIMAIQKIKRDENDIPNSTIPVKAYTEAIKWKKEITVKDTIETHGMTFDPIPEQYPRTVTRLYSTLLRNKRDAILKLGINATELKNLADALGCDRLNLYFCPRGFAENGGYLAAIPVEPFYGGETIGLIMPIRTSL